MIRYILKVTATGTYGNPNFAGEVHTYYYGKDQHLISNKAEQLDALDEYLVTEYGYKRKCDADKAAKFWAATYDEKYWDYEVGIIEYRV